jgi:hypothetical protein
MIGVKSKFHFSKHIIIIRLEIRKLKIATYETAPTSFVFSSSIKETVGGVLKKIGRH